MRWGAGFFDDFRESDGVRETDEMEMKFRAP